MTKHMDLSVLNKAGGGISCPKCGAFGSGVHDSRSAILGGTIHTIKRRRQCEPCGHRYTTFEITAEVVERLDAVANDRRTPSRREVIMSVIRHIEGML